VQALEDPEQFVGVSHVEADSVISHVVDRGMPVCGRRCAHFDFSLRAPWQGGKPETAISTLGPVSARKSPSACATREKVGKSSR
jgi:hypothetical protein